MHRIAAAGHRSARALACSSVRSTPDTSATSAFDYRRKAITATVRSAALFGSAAASVLGGSQHRHCHDKASFTHPLPQQASHEPPKPAECSAASARAAPANTGGQRAEHEFKLARAMIVTKLSRLELEQHRQPHLNAVQLERFVRDRGTDYDSLLYHHHIHKNFQARVAECFTEAGVQVRIANRLNLTADEIKWADMLVPIGGDGTFLMAAGRASPMRSDAPVQTPVVGFNSDPVRSEGRLMLPKNFSHDPRAAVRKIIEGDFRWVRRSRIKVTLLGQNGDLSSAVDLYEPAGSGPPGDVEPRPVPLNDADRLRFDSKMKKPLPYLALNEVFIGETMAARVSHLHISKDGQPTVTKTKSSGLCVSTGTGSSSWLTSINRLSAMNMRKLLEILARRHVVNETLTRSGDVDAEAICDEYNNRLLFAADDPRMCYSIREQICVGVWPNPKGFQSRGFCRSMLIKSRCMDASLVIDGSIAYPFNDGAKALLEVHPEDSLLTMHINDNAADDVANVNAGRT